MNWLEFGGQRSKVKVTVTSRLSHSRERYISGTPGGNFITSGTNGLEFGGQKSKVTELTKHVFGLKQRIHMLITTVFFFY